MKKKVTSSAGAAPAEKPVFSVISAARLLEIYAAMVKCRMLGERARGMLGRSGSAKGLEAATVGAAMGLTTGDTIGPSHCEWATRLVRGAKVRTLLRQTGAPEDAAAQLTEALGRALVAKSKKSGRVSMAFSCGKGLEAEWREVLEVAGAERLPLIFVAMEPLRSGAAGRVKLTAPTAGVPTMTVDGNDAVAVYRVATEAIAKARKGCGPTLIECLPFDLPGQAMKPKRRARRQDPIRNMESYLSGKGLFSEELKRRLVKAFEAELDRAIAASNH